VTLFGLNLGPGGIVQAVANSAGFFETALAGTRVLFDGIASPMIYTSANQITAVVPYVVSKPVTHIEVEYQGRRSMVFNDLVADTAPGIFTVGQDGAILNEDGTLNSAANPARNGFVISIFGTGGGQTNPRSVDGQVAGAPSPGALPPRIQDVQVFGPSTDGQPYQVLYAGSAPGLISGVFQINARLPTMNNVGFAGTVGVSIGGISANPVRLYGRQ
jgi:uncharacterized protein (TIGR03437 family)